MRGLTQEDKDDIVESWQNLVRMTDIAKQYDLSRQRIWQVLNAAGVDTSKGKIIVTCDECGKEFERHKGQVRKRRRCFCSNDCYYIWLAGRSADYKPWRHGMRIARRVASEWFTLKQKNVVHHEDGNNKNNNLDNLKAFRNQADHLRYHRGFNVQPIWEGCNPTRHNRH